MDNMGGVMDNMGGVMDNMLASSAVDRVFCSNQKL